MLFSPTREIVVKYPSGLLEKTGPLGSQQAGTSVIWALEETQALNVKGIPQSIPERSLSEGISSLFSYAQAFKYPYRNTFEA